MILNNTHAKRSNNNDDNLIPLINIVFLMLIFFMVAGQIQPSDGVKVESPTSISDTTLTPERLKLVISEDGQLFIDGQSVPKEALSKHVLNYLDTLSDQQKPHAAVVLKADGNLSVDRMQDYVKTVRASGISHISLMTQPSAQVAL